MNLFEKNIKYFYEHIPSYYQLITSIKTRRFVIKNNNIYDTHTNSYFYPTQNGQSLMEQVSELYANNPMKNNLWHKLFLLKHLPSYDEKILPITSKICNEIVQVAKDSPSYVHDSYIFQPKFLHTVSIFGIGSGLHIQKLTQKYKFQSLFVYEPEPEFFAISCYFVDWQQIFEELDDRFYLFVKGHIDTKVLKSFYDTRTITSNFLRVSFSTYESDKIKEARDEFFLANISNKRGWGSFEDESVGFRNHLNNINKNIPILSSTSKIQAPICVVANGASLNNDIEWIRQNKDNMIIISVGTAIRPLLKAGIDSDFHIEIERMPKLVDILKDSLKQYKGYFVGASVIDPRHFRIAKKPLMFVRDASSTTGVSNFYLDFCSPMVGNTGFSFAAHFSNEIYMVGFDVGFKKGKRVHASGSLYDDLDDYEEGSSVRGNFSDDVYSNDLLNLSRQSLEMAISILKPNKVYNLSDGAFIHGTIPKRSHDITLPKLTKRKYIKQILKHFKKDKIRLLNYAGFLDLYKNKIIELLSQQPKDRFEIMEIIDKINEYTLVFLRYEPAVGTLMKGSVWHILNAIYLSIHKCDVSEYPKMVEVVKKHFDKYQLPTTNSH
ncbi:MAG: motility associated factor glycosyltransferase family protein [Epsilonproteobacteria bacterium]|nr:motility associated factor glycosyltransferase family protein [Campylobacterota bacterium]